MQNIGIGDRIVRVFVGIGLLALVVFLPGPLRWFGFLGLVPLMTAMVGVCPFYRALHIHTGAAH